MHTFKSFTLLEYLTDKQRVTYSKIEMTPKARADTDHFFGVNNDSVREEIKNYDHDKSEIHKKVEGHLGTQISSDEYKSGIIKDKYNRPVKLGRAIKDEKLRNEFASDNTRALSKQQTKPHITVVRGAEVAGQTNPEPNKEHPSGHSWKDISCKNITSGVNKKYLEHEVRHGTVLVRAHDGDGKEIYRATLQPYHNDKGHSAYHVNGEYGIKHPSFSEHANDVAKRLSGEHKGGSLMYSIHRQVYDDNNKGAILHPNASEKDISKALDHENFEVRRVALTHPKVNTEHISKALKDKFFVVRNRAIAHPKATEQHITKALKQENESNSFSENEAHRVYAISNPNVTEKHLDSALNDSSPYVRETAIKNPKATAKHISKALTDKDIDVRKQALAHPNVTQEHIEAGLKDSSAKVRKVAKTIQSQRFPNLSKT
jgi:t-SNARE complex subunit (syntaxin)